MLSGVQRSALALSVGFIQHHILRSWDELKHGFLMILVKQVLLFHQQYDSSSLPALLFKARTILGAKKHLKTINYQLEKLLEQEWEPGMSWVSLLLPSLLKLRSWHSSNFRSENQCGLLIRIYYHFVIQTKLRQFNCSSFRSHVVLTVTNKFQSWHVSHHLALEFDPITNFLIIPSME